MSQIKTIQEQIIENNVNAAVVELNQALMTIQQKIPNIAPAEIRRAWVVLETNILDQELAVLAKRIR